MLPGWHDAPWQSAALAPGGGAVSPQINALPLYNYYSFFILSGHSFSWLWTPELRGFSVYFFKSAHAYGWRKCTNAKDYIFPSVVVGSMVTVTESKGNANAEVAPGAGTEPLCIRLACI